MRPILPMDVAMERIRREQQRAGTPTGRPAAKRLQGFDPAFEAMLRREQVAGVLEQIEERLAIERLGGRLLTAPWTKRDRNADSLLAQEMGFRGIDVCGCREAGCDTCNFNPPEPEQVALPNCDCGTLSCHTCAEARVRQVSGGRRTGVVLLNPLDGGGGSWPAVIQADPTGTNGPVLDLGIVDVHSHHFNYTLGDLYHALDGLGGTETDTRIDRLYRLAADGISRMVISGHFDDSIRPIVSVDHSPLDLSVQYAWSRYPDFFLRFARGFELDDPAAPLLVEFWLGNGFSGVGELFVHAYRDSDFPDNDVLIEICRTAKEYDVPVQVHWNIGTIDNEAHCSAANNYDQLIDLLNSMERRGGAPDIILAHCGLGPTQAPSGRLLERWQERIVEVLEDWPMVHFDLGGMQISSQQEPVLSLFIPGTPPTPTEVGTFLLEQMATHPDRFMLGLDTRNSFDVETLTSLGWLKGVDNYRTSIIEYETFLEQGALGLSDIWKIKWGNARRILGI